MSDWEEYDDNELKELEKRLKKIYRQAYRESQEKVDKYFKSFAEEDEEMRILYLQGKITKDEYRAWRQKKMLSGKHWTDLRDQIVERIHDANKTAEQIINDETPKTYTRNYNHTQFEGDLNVGVSFELTNENAVKQALKSNHVTFKTVKINDSKDTRYTQERLTNELVSGIVQGKTWREMAKSYQNVLNGSYSQAVRSARTSYTSAQNSGRLDSFERFERAGIKVLKEWMSTKDERTRESHAQLNGVRVAVKEKFPNGLMYPGDPEGSPSEVYNCRCKLVSFFPGSSRDRGLGNTVETYENWLSNKYANGLISDAKQKDKIITPLLTSIVNEGNGHLEGLDYRIKGKESLSRKLKSKSKSKGISIDEYSKKVTDVLRYTNISSENDLTNDYFIIVEGLKKQGYNMIEVTNTFNVDGAYKGINTLVQDLDGYVFELQFHTPKSLEIKEINHKLYEEQRLDSTPNKRKAELNDIMRNNANSVSLPKGIDLIKNKK